MQTAFLADLTRRWRTEPATDHTEWVAWEGFPIPGVAWFHPLTRQAAAQPVLITAPVGRALLLVEWEATPRGEASIAFRPVKKHGRKAKRLQQLRSVVLTDRVPAHRLYPYIMNRIQELFAPELGGRKLRFRDVLAIAPRAESGATATALHKYFKKRIGPALAAKAKRKSPTPGSLSARSSAVSRGSSSRKSRRK